MASKEKTENLTFMAVHAHPDDEVFGSGGTFARLSREGVHTVLVTGTLGEHGEIVDPEMDEETRQATFPRLGEVREVELRNAVAALKISELRLLGFRDSGMVGTPENAAPESFHQANFDEAVKRLVKIIREEKPQVIATYEPFGGYGHPDHIQAHRVTVVAFEAAGNPRFYPELELEPWKPSKLYYMAFPRSFFQKMAQEAREKGIEGPWNNPEMDTDSWGVPDEEITTRLDVSGYVEQKMAAFRAHKTQIAPNNFMFVIPEDMRPMALGYEHFVLARNNVPGYEPLRGEALEEDLFGGLR
jgi:N-acetyl-1-D-myo-inositol-2-amino-2-deoxy-alpha-D-glucopyranoside deacetylase